jgi:hypothetical protein
MVNILVNLETSNGKCEILNGEVRKSSKVNSEE